MRGRSEIVLVGMPGSGKTQVGRLLAGGLGVSFLDSDHEIELAAGTSIKELFASDGEAAFRALEEQVIGRLLDGTPKVLALGGGAFQSAATRSRVLERCTAIWLDVPLAALADRLAGNSARPLLQGADMEGLLRCLYEERVEHYRSAHLHVSAPTSVGTVEEIVRAIGAVDR